MPWKPSFTGAVQVDHRLNPYRDRGALVFDGDRQVMRVYVQVDTLCTQQSGHLWWRTWSEPVEFVVLHMLLDEGDDDDAWLADESLTGELDDWAQGVFRYRGRALSLTWLDLEASAELRMHLGLG